MLTGSGEKWGTRYERKACLEWGWAGQSPQAVPPLLGLLAYGSKDTNKLRCFQSLEHPTLCCRARALVLPFCSLGICGWGAKARHFARVCTSTEQIISHRNEFLCAFSFRLISYIKIICSSTHKCLSIAWIIAYFPEKCALFWLIFRLPGLFLLRLLPARGFSASADLLLCCHASLKLVEELQVSHLCRIQKCVFSPWVKSFLFVSAHARGLMAG